MYIGPTALYTRGFFCPTIFTLKLNLQCGAEALKLVGTDVVVVAEVEPPPPPPPPPPVEVVVVVLRGRVVASALVVAYLVLMQGY